METRDNAKKKYCEICVTNVSQSVRFDRDGTSQAWGHGTQRPGIEPATVRLRVRHANHYAPDLLTKLSYRLVLKKKQTSMSTVVSVLSSTLEVLKVLLFVYKY